MEDPNLRVRQTGLDLEYLKSIPGLLKIVEIVCMYVCINIQVYLFCTNGGCSVNC